MSEQIGSPTSGNREAWRRMPKISRDALVSDLRRLGVAPGMPLLVHSSLSRLGQVVGGAEAVIDALLDAVSPEGTVLFPTLTGSDRDGPECPPRLDARVTPCWTGRIPETARRRPNALRSAHPTHSVAAIGAAAARWTAGHEDTTTPCDERSPYYRLIQEDGSILLLGVSQSSSTALHCLEELAEVPYHLQDRVTECPVTDLAGRALTVRNRLHLWRWRRDFPKVDPLLVRHGALRMGRVGLAESRLMSARRLAEALLPRLREEPLFLLDSAVRREFAG